jgi:hypothetical protein
MPTGVECDGRRGVAGLSRARGMPAIS